MVEDVSIAFWGPKGSGKSSMIYSFGYAVTRKYEPQNGLRVFLREIDGKTPVFIDKPSSIKEIRDGTEDYTIKNWKIGRTPEGRLNPIARHLKRASTFTHDIAFFDDKGARLVELVNGRKLFSEQQFARARSMLVNAHNTIILLDPSLLDDSELEVGVEVSKYTRDEYRNFVKTLCRMIWKERNAPGRFAVCFTKSDKLNLGRVERAKADDENKWGLIEDEFGPEMVAFFHSQVQHEIKPFIVSSMKDDKDAWDPDDVELPIFWLLEKTELEILQPKQKKRYLKYPISRDSR
ncbi:MAG: hypothetical protein DWQ07_26005 [Chloroflexi bacterium]|nr:MAG: hypothetical protein DWQ07_26005 [Chloroflexota bacterium]